MAKILLVRWRDAMYVEGDAAPPVPELAELDCVGFLLGETEEAIMLAMESEHGRWRVSIPRTQIISVKELTPKRMRKVQNETLVG